MEYSQDPDELTTIITADWPGKRDWIFSLFQNHTNYYKDLRSSEKTLKVIHGNTTEMRKTDDFLTHVKRLMDY